MLKKMECFTLRELSFIRESSWFKDATIKIKRLVLEYNSIE
jgi:hypothetical protein